jgi:hypothetical protein
MTIAFDNVNNRATDATSGMAVTYIRDDYPQERGEFWLLTWKGEEHEFRVGWEDGYLKITRERPGLSIDEITKLTNDLNLMEYEIQMVVRSLHEREFLDNIDLFIDLFSTVARERFHSRNIRVIFKPLGVAEKYHRELHFPPLDAGDTEHGRGAKSQ